MTLAPSKSARAKQSGESVSRQRWQPCVTLLAPRHPSPFTMFFCFHICPCCIMRFLKLPFQSLCCLAYAGKFHMSKRFPFWRYSRWFADMAPGLAGVQRGDPTWDSPRRPRSGELFACAQRAPPRAAPLNDRCGKLQWECPSNPHAHGHWSCSRDLEGMIRGTRSAGLSVLWKAGLWKQLRGAWQKSPWLLFIQRNSPGEVCASVYSTTDGWYWYSWHYLVALAWGSNIQLLFRENVFS